MERFSLGIILTAFLVLLQNDFLPVTANVVDLTESNVDTILKDTDVVLVNFYADWCRFSQILKPTFEEAGKKVSEEITTPGKIVFAKVDCDKEVNVASRFRINKYPTLKLFRNGNIVKKEYRGQRSVEALVQFAHEEAKDSVKEVTHLDNLEKLDAKKRNIIGYFESKDSNKYLSFSKTAGVLRDDCSFHAAFGPVSFTQRQEKGDVVKFGLPNSDNEEAYSGPIDIFESLFKWSVEKCLPLVREITFENAEELTEEGLPFLILFHDSDDTASLELFQKEVSKQVAHEKANINFLVADGQKFAHPLHHLGKSVKDLPVLAIDSFRHMYVFPHNVKENLGTPGLLKTFIEDLHSGKLHREFHHGPDPTTPIALPPIEDGSNLPRDDNEGGQPPAPPKTSPPESTFKKLAPSRNRYTILRDEL